MALLAAEGFDVIELTELEQLTRWWRTPVPRPFTITNVGDTDMPQFTYDIETLQPQGPPMAARRPTATPTTQDSGLAPDPADFVDWLRTLDSEVVAPERTRYERFAAIAERMAATQNTATARAALVAWLLATTPEERARRVESLGFAPEDLGELILRLGRSLNTPRHSTTTRNIGVDVLSMNAALVVSVSRSW